MNLNDFMNSGDHRDRSRQREIAEFEEAKVKLLLKVAGMNVGRTIGVLRDHEKRTTGRDHATFVGFSSLYSFPFLFGVSKLGGVKLHTDPRSLLPSMLQRFQKTPFAVEYDTFYDNNQRFANGRTLGLIFPRKGFKYGLVMYYVDTLAAVSFADSEAAVVYATQTKTGTSYAVVRSYQRLIEAVYASGWRPD